MKVLFDLSAVQTSVKNYFNGGSEYTKTVFFKLCETLNNYPDINIEVFYNPNKILDETIFNICGKYGFEIHKCYNNNDINLLLQNNQYNVFYTALPYSYYSLKIPDYTKFIYTIHGLRTLETPLEKYYFKYNNKIKLRKKIRHLLSFIPLFKKYYDNEVIKRFNRLFTVTQNQTIVTVSNHSKYSISYFCSNINPERIKVFYSPLKEYNFSENISKDSDLKTLNLEAGKYILLLTGNKAIKGAYRACIVLNNLIKENKLPIDIKIIVLGVSYTKHYLKLTKNNPRFLFYKYVSAEDLEHLYKNACLYLCPSLNEGFGYPPLEAMKYGTLCACSANSALTEVYGDSVLYFNPFDLNEMGNRILQSFDDEIRNDYKIRIPKRFEYIRNRQIQDLDLLIKEILLKKD